MGGGQKGVGASGNLAWWRVVDVFVMIVGLGTLES